MQDSFDTYLKKIMNFNNCSKKVEVLKKISTSNFKSQF